MKHLRYFSLVFFLLVAVLNSAFAQILPSPMDVVVGQGVFELKDNTVIAYEGIGKNTATYLADKLAISTAYTFSVKDKKKKHGILFTAAKADPTLGPEGYILEIAPQGMTIRATSETGMFYAVQSLLQLFEPEIFSSAPVAKTAWPVPCQVIKDKPKYAWRSFMLDSGRQFQTPEFIKRYIDLLALLKINVFHWHLSEGQGWRLEIKKYPRLTSVGSRVAKGKEQQGYYTQEDVREIVRYAQQRHITVIPELDVPGHSEAALTAYPELTCLKKAPESVMSFSSHLFCGGSEDTYTFLEHVLDEVVALFPSEYIHLGGDEAPKADWDACAVCQKKIREEKLKDSHDLQLYFSKRLASYLKTKNKKVIFWGDIVYEDGTALPDNVVIQWWNWRSRKDLAYKNAIRNRYPVIAATNYYAYLNFPVTPWSKYNEARVFDMRTAYEENPSDLKDPHPLVLGMSTSLWTDWHVQQHMIDRRVFPRIYALTEQMWHVGDRLPYESFRRVVESKYPALKALHVDYGPADKSDIQEGFSWE